MKLKLVDYNLLSMEHTRRGEDLVLDAIEEADTRPLAILNFPKCDISNYIVNCTDPGHDFNSTSCKLFNIFATEFDLWVEEVAVARGRHPE